MTTTNKVNGVRCGVKDRILGYVSCKDCGAGDVQASRGLWSRACGLEVVTLEVKLKGIK